MNADKHRYFPSLFSPPRSSADPLLVFLICGPDAFCVYSRTYRGSRERPGLVLGLDRGGSCVGRAYAVPAGRIDEVRRYLHDREMEYDVYRQATCHARRADGRRVAALTHVVNRSGSQYTGRLDEARMVELVLQGRGSMGTCRDYLASTVRYLDDIGIADGSLHRLLARLEAARGHDGRA